MPHQCLKCDKVFDNTDDAIIRGCPNCGSKLFLYIKKIPDKQEDAELSKVQKDLILKEAENFVDLKESDGPIFFKLENIRILAPGKYEIDVNQLLKKNKPLIYRVQDGTYLIDLNYLNSYK